jgi:hypothetical protein
MVGQEPRNLATCAAQPVQVPSEGGEGVGLRPINPGQSFDHERDRDYDNDCDYDSDDDYEREACCFDGLADRFMES